jgi:hypothetical protein
MNRAKSVGLAGPTAGAHLFGKLRTGPWRDTNGVAWVALPRVPSHTDALHFPSSSSGAAVTRSSPHSFMVLKPSFLASSSDVLHCSRRRGSPAGWQGRRSGAPRPSNLSAVAVVPAGIAGGTRCPAGRRERAYEALGQDGAQGRSERVGADAHGEQALDGFHCGVRVQRREHDVPRERAAFTAVCAVSRSRISPTRITSGSWRRMERSPLLKL